MPITFRGTCSSCKRRFRLRRDGMIRRHVTIFSWKKQLLCLGSELPPVEEMPLICTTGCSGCKDMIKYGI